VVVLGMVFFRAQSLSDAISYISRLLLWSHGTRLGSPYIPAAVIAVALVHFTVRKDWNLATELPQKGFIPRMAAYASLLTTLVLLGATDAAPFIYFQF
jgi:hypothetical protein